MTALLGQFSRFVLVGGTATALHYSLLWLLHEQAGWAALPATVAGSLLGALFNFIANRRYTFRSRAPMARTAARFTIVAGSGLVLNALVFAGLYRLMPGRYLVAQAISTGLVMLWNFTLGRLFTFADTAPASTAEARDPG